VHESAFGTKRTYRDACYFGAGYITIFAGEEAEARARDYHDALRDGRLDPRIADAQRGGPFTISPSADRPVQRRRRA
jgi:hypothetical protein